MTAQTKFDNYNHKRGAGIMIATLAATMGLFVGGYHVMTQNGLINLETIEQLGEGRKQLGATFQHTDLALIKAA